MFDAELKDAPAEARARFLTLARAESEGQLARLGRLADLGLDIGDQVKQRFAAETERAPDPAPQLSNSFHPQIDIGLTYNRIARAVRLAIALQTRVLKELAGFEAAAANRWTADLMDEDDDPRHIRKTRIDRIVRRVAKGEIDDADEVEHLSSAAWERLEEDDIYGDVMSRPIGEIVDLICKALDLSPDWDVLATEAWAQEEIAAADTRSPFAALAPPGWGEASAEPPPDPDSS